MSPKQHCILKESEGRMEDCVRLKGYSYETLKAYRQWLRRYLIWLCDSPIGQSFSKADPANQKAEAFLTDLARSNVSASTQNGAFAALRFWYVDVLKVPFENVNALRAKVGERVRTAPSVDEVKRLLTVIQDTKSYPCRLIACLMYACGLRVNETLSIRLKDIDLHAGKLVIQQGKGKKDRFINLAPSLIEPLRLQARFAWRLHKEIAAAGIPLQLPNRLAVKYPKCRFSWKWMWLFPLATPSKDPHTGETVWWHCLDTTIQRAMADACDALRMPGAITPHHLRHAWATHAHRAGAAIRDLAEVLGHADIRTTMRYVTPDPEAVPSPFESVASILPKIIPFPKTA